MGMGQVNIVDSFLHRGASVTFPNFKVPQSL